jgi:mRNA-degrading endonuclease RelE of RelBE toxin-antitoxin system
MLDIIFEEDFHKDMKDLDKTIRKEIQNQLLKLE